MRGLSRLTSVILGALLVLGALNPAGAKGVGFEHGEIEGPGLERPIVIANRNPYILDSELFEMIAGHNPGSSVPSPTVLGPRYWLRYHLSDGRRVLVYFYPYAEPRPVGFVPAGQFVDVPTDDGPEEVRLESTWYDYPPPFVEMLQERGLPLRTDRGSSTSLSGALSLLLVALLLVLVVRMRRPGRAQPHAA